jgi:hypothetical protein
MARGIRSGRPYHASMDIMEAMKKVLNRTLKQQDVVEYGPAEIVGIDGISASFQVVDDKSDATKIAVEASMFPYHKYMKEVTVELQEDGWFNVWIAVL